MTLKDLMVCRLEDVHLVHNEEETEPATIVELDSSTLTEEGQRAWADVLDAKVVRIFEGIYGTQIELCDVMPHRLERFGMVLAGNVSCQEDKLWIQQKESIPQNNFPMEPGGHTW